MASEDPGEPPPGGKRAWRLLPEESHRLVRYVCGRSRLVRLRPQCVLQWRLLELRWLCGCRTELRLCFQRWLCGCCTELRMCRRGCCPELWLCGRPELRLCLELRLQQRLQ